MRPRPLPERIGGLPPTRGARSVTRAAPRIAQRLVCARMIKGEPGVNSAAAECKGDEPGFAFDAWASGCENLLTDMNKPTAPPHPTLDNRPVDRNGRTYRNAPSPLPAAETGRFRCGVEAVRADDGREVRTPVRRAPAGGFRPRTSREGEGTVPPPAKAARTGNKQCSVD
jgi:hypothetical protein